MQLVATTATRPANKIRLIVFIAYIGLVRFVIYIYNVRVGGLLCAAAMLPFADKMRAAQSPTHSANIRKCEINTKFGGRNGYILFILGPAQARGRSVSPARGK